MLGLCTYAFHCVMCYIGTEHPAVEIKGPASGPRGRKFDRDAVMLDVTLIPNEHPEKEHGLEHVVDAHTHTYMAVITLHDGRPPPSRVGALLDVVTGSSHECLQRTLGQYLFAHSDADVLCADVAGEAVCAEDDAVIDPDAPSLAEDIGGIKAYRVNTVDTIFRKWTDLWSPQPLWEIRNYMGERLAMYYAWLGHYSANLVPLSVLGILIMIYGIVHLHRSRAQVGITRLIW